jgi:hypothetical protein
LCLLNSKPGLYFEGLIYRIRGDRRRRLMRPCAEHLQRLKMKLDEESEFELAPV